MKFHSALVIPFALFFSLFLLGTSPLITMPALANESIPVGRWLSSSFISPQDQQQWHGTFFVSSVRPVSEIYSPDLMRHAGLMLRCTAADIPKKLRVLVSFGEVLKTNEYGEITIRLRFDNRGLVRIPAITRNQTNAEVEKAVADDVVARLLASSHLEVRAPSAPKGTVSLDFVTGHAREQITTMFSKCGIPLPNLKLPETELPKQQVVRAVDGQRDEQRSDQRGERRGKQKAERKISAPYLGYFSAKSKAERELAAVDLAATKVDVHTLAHMLRQGPIYSKPSSMEFAPPGNSPDNMFNKTSANIVGDTSFPFHIRIPNDYNPERKWPMIVYLHGGISRPPWRANEKWWLDAPFNEGFLEVSPAGWRKHPWWSVTQLENIESLMAEIKSRYNVDENRVYLVGVSDGGAGAMFFSTRRFSPFAAFVSIIGHPDVLNNRHAYGKNDILNHPFQNMSNRPWLFVNGGRDPLYSIESLHPFFTAFREMGVNFRSLVQEDQEHSLDRNEELIEALAGMFSVQRESYPGSIYWQGNESGERTDWLLVEALETGASGEIVPDGCIETELTHVDGEGLPGASHYAVNIRSRGIRRIKLFLPLGEGTNVGSDSNGLKLKVSVNGQDTKNLVLSPSLETLLFSHALEFDRTRLYGYSTVVEISDDQSEVCR